MSSPSLTGRANAATFSGLPMTKTDLALRMREQGLKYQEIAKVLGISTNSVGVLLCQRRKRERKLEAKAHTGSDAWWKERGY